MRCETITIPWCHENEVFLFEEIELFSDAGERGVSVGDTERGGRRHGRRPAGQSDGPGTGDALLRRPPRRRHRSPGESITSPSEIAVPCGRRTVASISVNISTIWLCGQQKSTGLSRSKLKLFDAL